MDTGILVVTIANALMIICSMFIQCYSIYSHKYKNNSVKFSNIGHDGQITKLHINNFSDEVNLKKGVSVGMGKASMPSPGFSRDNKDMIDPINKNGVNMLYSSVENLKADVQIARGFAQAFVDTVKSNNESNHSDHVNAKSKAKHVEVVETHVNQPMRDQKKNAEQSKEYIVTAEQMKEIEMLKRKLDQALVKFNRSTQDLDEHIYESPIGQSSYLTDELV